MLLSPRAAVDLEQYEWPGLPLATTHDNADLVIAMNEIRPPRRRRTQPQPDLAPAGTPPHVAVAPGVLDQQHVVIRAADDTGEDYGARRRVFAAALAFARKD
jgi:hypothetical protein